ncbi:MAG: hypothetical protein AAGB46_13345 [Verrucomicrobiota bacterium]
MLDLIKDALRDFDAIVFMGVRGSGKTTTARAFAERREMVFVDAEESPDPSDDYAAYPNLLLINNLITQHASNKETVALACPALTEKQRSWLAEGELRMHYVLLEGDIETIEKRLGDNAPSNLQEDFQALEVPADAIRVDIRQHVESIMTNVDFQLIQASAHA